MEPGDGTDRIHWSWISDDQLVLHALSGRGPAIVELLARHERQVCRRVLAECRRYQVSPQVLRDAQEEVFAALDAALRSYRLRRSAPARSFLGYWTLVAQRRGADVCRHEQCAKRCRDRRLSVEQAADTRIRKLEADRTTGFGFLGHASDPARLFDQSEWLEQLKRAVSNLPLRLRWLWWQLVEETSLRDIARARNITLRTAQIWRRELCSSLAEKLPELERLITKNGHYSDIAIRPRKYGKSTHS